MAKPNGKRGALAEMEGVAPEKEKEKWADWSRKIERIEKRDLDKISQGWLAHIPQLKTPGVPPPSLAEIAPLLSLFPQVKGDGDLIEHCSGARPTVLHEAIYWSHKAVHGQMAVDHLLGSARYTWAVIDAYQSSLYALNSILAFLGIATERHNNNFIFIDVWGHAIDATPRRPAEEKYQLVRWKVLDHFHKWAILKRALRQLNSRTPLADFLLEAIGGVEDKVFAKHRNFVHYDVGGWLANDLFTPPTGMIPVVAAAAKEDVFREIYESSPTGCIYLMVILVELACSFIDRLRPSGVVVPDIRCLERRRIFTDRCCPFDFAATFQC